MKCKHCGDPLDSDGCTHGDRCCDCFDLSFGMPLAAINRERTDKGRQPITRTWPGLNENGDPS